MSSYAPEAIELDEYGRLDMLTNQQTLEEHEKSYFKSKTDYEQKQNDNYWSFTNVVTMLREKPIMCQKYNYTLDIELMNHFCFDCRLTVSEDGSEIIIHNKKMNTDPKYNAEQTPDELREFYRQRDEARANGVVF